MKVLVRDIYKAVDNMAPFSLSMDFDNTGLLVGDENDEVTGVLLALDCTDAILDEAQKQGANLILTHHPIIFKGIKNVRADSVVYQAIRRGIHVISAHTNLDIAQGGVNDCLSRQIGLTNLRGLTVTNSTPYQKIVAFVPETHWKAVYDAMTAAGAGTMENYKGCAYLTHGEGTFLPMEGANPFLGTLGERETVKEVRIEMICPSNKTKDAIAAMKQAHPYEVPAYDIVEDQAIMQTETLGRVGDLAHSMTPQELAEHVKKQLGGGSIRYTQGCAPITSVAVCGGAGDSELESAMRCGAQALITGEVKHHIFLEASRKKITLIEAGHFETEDVVLDPLKARLAAQFPELSFSVCHKSEIYSM